MIAQDFRFETRKNQIIDPDYAQNENNILSQLDHPNIINYMKGVIHKKYSYILLENWGIDLGEYLVKHSSLSSSQNTLNSGITEEPLENEINENILREVAWQVLKALNYLHSHYIVHKDIKPENILITEGKQFGIKLIDFGITVNINGYNEEDIFLTGTNSYIAPELFVDPTKLTTKVDSWALGVTLFKMVTGIEPFVEPNSIKLTLQIINSEPDFSSEKWNKISLQGKEFIRKLLSKKISERPSAEEALKDNWFSELINGQILMNENILQKLGKFLKMEEYQRRIFCLLARLSKSSEIESIINDFNILDVDHDGELKLFELKGLCKSEEDLEKCLGSSAFSPSLCIKFSEFTAALLPKSVLAKCFKIKILYELLKVIPKEFQAEASTNIMDPNSPDSTISSVEADIIAFERSFLSLD